MERRGLNFELIGVYLITEIKSIVVDEGKLLINVLFLIFTNSFPYFSHEFLQHQNWRGIVLHDKIILESLVIWWQIELMEDLVLQVDQVIHEFFAVEKVLSIWIWSIGLHVLEEDLVLLFPNDVKILFPYLLWLIRIRLKQAFLQKISCFIFGHCILFIFLSFNDHLLF